MTTDSRILDFLPDRSTGLLSVLPDDDEWVPLAEARWSVLVPAGMPVQLFRAKDATDEHLTPLASLPPDALDILVLLDRPITDTGLARVAGLTGLRLLDLFRTAVTDAGLRHLANLRRLEWLSLTGCDVGDHGVTALAGLSRLWRLSLKRTQVTDAVLDTLVQLPELRWLSLSGTAVSDAAIERLAALPALRSVALDASAVSPVGQAELILRRPDVEVIGH